MIGRKCKHKSISLLLAALLLLTSCGSASDKASRISSVVPNDAVVPNDTAVSNDAVVLNDASQVDGSAQLFPLSDLTVFSQNCGGTRIAVPYIHKALRRTPVRAE